MDERKKWTLEMDATLVEMRRERKSYAEIAAYLGTTYHAVHNHAKRMNLPAFERREPRRWTPALEAQIVKMHETMAIGEIADELGVGYEAIRTRLRRIGTPVTPDRQPRFRRKKPDGPLGELELAPGHFAVDARSYELIREAGKDGEEECLTTL